MVEEFRHTTSEGKEIKLKNLTLKHLQSIIKWIERKAKYGLILRMGGGSTDEDMWYDEEVLHGKQALDYLNYNEYVQELNKRINKMERF